MSHSELHFTLVKQWEKQGVADLLVFPFYQGVKGPEWASSDKTPSALVADSLALRDFKGSEGDILFVYTQNKKGQRIALLGFGKQDSVTVETIRRSYGSLIKACRDKDIASIHILTPSVKNMEESSLATGICEGLLLANYRFSLKQESKKKPSTQISHIHLIGLDPSLSSVANECVKIAKAVYFVRDLVNGNADDITPQYLAAQAKKLAKQLPKTKVTVFDKQRIEKEGMGLLLAVNRGSHRDPTFTILEYKGNPRSQDRVVLVGKGITFDTGGLNLKPLGNIEEQRIDMAGAAVALGTVYTAASLGLPVNVTAVVPSTENAIGGNSYKPGDIYVSYSGKSVEIGNTDAEGRLILADALAYAAKNLNPSCLIDIATLTGSIIIALGDGITGYMSNNTPLSESLEKAGHITDERVWKLPLLEEYRKKLDSDHADIKSTGGRPGGAILAALFLRDFVGDVPWAHLDIAGTAHQVEEGRGYLPKHATGVGVRLLTEFLKLFIGSTSPK